MKDELITNTVVEPEVISVVTLSVVPEGEAQQFLSKADKMLADAIEEAARLEGAGKAEEVRRALETAVILPPPVLRPVRGIR